MPFSIQTPTLNITQECVLSPGVFGSCAQPLLSDCQRIPMVDVNLNFEKLMAHHISTQVEDPTKSRRHTGHTGEEIDAI